MANLNNTNRLIDAVLTRAGRRAMANGTFEISKWALADDEINYQLAQPKNTEGYKFLTIDQTPITEAVASGEGSMKFLLYDSGRSDLLYAPVIRQFLGRPYGMFTGGTTSVSRYVIACDQDTFNAINSGQEEVPEGVQDGKNFSIDHACRCDQGLDTNQIPPSIPLIAALKETQYIIQIDDRLGRIISKEGQKPSSLTKNFVSQDNIALYTAALSSTNRGNSGTAQFVAELLPELSGKGSSITGPRGTAVQFRVAAQDNLSSTTSFFSRWGTATLDAIGSAAAGSLTAISSTITIKGFQTGFTISLPVQFVKKI